MNSKIELFEKSQEAHTELNKVLKIFLEQKKKALKVEVATIDGLNQFALNDIATKKPTAAMANERTAQVQKLEVWITGFQTVVGVSNEFLKEMAEMKTRIDALNKQVCDIEGLKKSSGEKENLSTTMMDYEQNKAQLMKDLSGLLQKKDELSARWMEKWRVLDQRFVE